MDERRMSLCQVGNLATRYGRYSRRTHVRRTVVTGEAERVAEEEPPAQ